MFVYLGDFILWWRATPGLWPLAKANFCKPGGLGAKFGLPWFGFIVGNGDFVGGEGEAEADGLVELVAVMVLLSPLLLLLQLPPPNNVDLLGAKFRNDPPDAIDDVTNDDDDVKLLLLWLLLL